MLYTRLASLLILSLLLVGFLQHVIQVTVLEAKSIIEDIARVRREVLIPLERSSYKPLNYTHNILITLEDASRNRSAILGIGAWFSSNDNISSWDTAIPLSDRRVAILRFEADWSYRICYIYYALYNDYTDEFERIYRYRADPYFCIYPSLYEWWFWGYSLMVGPNYTVYLIKRGYNYYEPQRFRLNGSSENFLNWEWADNTLAIARLGDEAPDAKALYLGRFSDASLGYWGVEDSNAIYMESRGGPSISATIQPYLYIQEYLYYDILTYKTASSRHDFFARNGIAILNMDNWSSPEAIYFTINTSGKGLFGKAIRTWDKGYLIAGLESDRELEGNAYCDVILVKYTGDLRIEWSRRYTLNVSAVYSDLGLRDWASNLTGDLRKDCRNLVRLDRSSPELKPELFVNRQGILLNEVIEEGVSKGYIVGISPWGSWTSPKGVNMYLYGFIAFMVNRKGEILWNTIFFTGAGTQDHYIAPIGGGLAAMGSFAMWSTPFGCCDDGSWFYWINISNGEMYYYSPPPSRYTPTKAQRPELAYVTWLTGRGLGSAQGNSSGVLFVRYAQDRGEPYSYTVGYPVNLEIGFATYDDIMSITNSRAPPYRIWFVTGDFNATEYNYKAIRYKPIIFNVEGPTRLPGTNITILPNEKAKLLTDIRSPDRVSIKMDTIFRYPKILLPGQLKFDREPRKPPSWSPLINNFIDLGAVKTGDQVTYRIEGIRLTPSAGNDPLLFIGDPHIASSAEGVKYSLGNYSSVALKQRFVIEVVLNPKAAGSRSFAIVFRENPITEKRPYPSTLSKTIYIGPHRVDFTALVTDYVPTISTSSINTSIKFPLTTVIVNVPIVTRPGVPERYNIHITNVGTEEAVFLYAVFMPFYIRVKGVIGGDSVFAISGSEDSDLVAAFAIRIPPGGLKSVQVVAAVERSHISELNPQGDGWRGWKIKTSGSGFQGYKPIAVQLASIPPALWSNLTRDLGRDPINLLAKAIDIGLEMHEERLRNLSKMPGVSGELERLRSSSDFGGVLADYIENQLWRRAVVDQVLLDLTNESNAQAMALSSPLEIASSGLEKLERQAREKLYGDLINASRTKGLEKLPPTVASLVEAAVIYNRMMLITMLVDPTYSYIPAEVTIENRGMQKTPSAGSVGQAGGLSQLASPALGGPRVVDGSVELQSHQGTTAATIQALVDPAFLFNCYKLAGKLGLMDPKTALQLRLASEGKLFYSAALLDLLDAMNKKVLGWREKYKGMSPQELLIHAMANNDKEAFAYYNYLRSAQQWSMGIGYGTGLAPIPGLDLVLASFLDNSGVGMVLQRFGVYAGGAIVDNSPQIEGSRQAFIAGLLTGSLVGFGTGLVEAGVNLPKTASSVMDLLKSVVGKKGLETNLKAYQDIEIINPQLVEISYNMYSKYLEPAIISSLAGETKTAQMLTQEAIELMNKQAQQLGIAGRTADMFTTNGKTYFFGQLTGRFEKPILIETGEALGNQPAYGAVVTLSKNPNTNAIYYGIGHTDQIIQAGNKQVYKADIHVTPNNGYTFSLAQDTALVNSKYLGYPKDQVISMWKSDEASKAVVGYLNSLKEPITGSYASDAAQFYALWSRVLNNQQDLKTLSSKLGKAPDAVADELRNAMKGGDYKTILDMGEKLGYVKNGKIENIKVKTLDPEDLLSRELLNNVDINNLKRAGKKVELEKKLSEAQQATTALIKGSEAIASIAKPSILVEPGREPPSYKIGVKGLRNLYTGSNGKSLEDCLPFIAKDLPDDALVFLGNIGVGFAQRDLLSSPSQRTRIVASTDPNQVYVEPRGFITSRGQDLRAMVEFENLANASASAINVSISLVVRGPVDPGSVELLDLSHRNAFLSIWKNASGNVVVLNITLSEINLPPNKRPPEGQGWALIGFKASKQISSGDALEVYADIVFDYNPPIRTNKEIRIADLEPPKTTLKKVETGNASIRVVGECSDRISGCESTLVTISKSSSSEVVRSIAINTSNNQVFEISIGDLEPGEYDITLTSIDRAGNSESKNTPDHRIRVEVTIAKPATTTKEQTTSRETPMATTPQQTTAWTTTATSTPTSTPAGSGSSSYTLIIAIAITAIAVAIGLALAMRSRRSK
jgi:hypothetical protein